MPKFLAPQKPKHESARNSYLILKYAHDTAESLLEAFATVRKARNAKQGAPTDEEQDLLRATVVFAGAGIDSMTKQLIRDTLPDMVKTLPPARERIEKLVSRHLKRGGAMAIDDDTGSAEINPQRIARILLADDPPALSVIASTAAATGASMPSSIALPSRRRTTWIRRVTISPGSPKARLSARLCALSNGSVVPSGASGWSARQGESKILSNMPPNPLAHGASRSGCRAGRCHVLLGRASSSPLETILPGDCHNSCISFRGARHADSASWRIVRPPRTQQFDTPGASFIKKPAFRRGRNHCA